MSQFTIKVEDEKFDFDAAAATPEAAAVEFAKESDALWPYEWGVGDFDWAMKVKVDDVCYAVHRHEGRWWATKDEGEPYDDATGFKVRELEGDVVLVGAQSATAYLHLSGREDESHTEKFEDGTPLCEAQNTMDETAQTLLNNCSSVDYGWLVTT